MSLAGDTETFRQRFFEASGPAIAERAAVAMDAIVQAAPSSAALGVGDPAPDFTCTDIHGRPMRLAQWLRSSPVVLDFHRGGWCPFCSLELRAWQARLEQLRAAGGTFLAIAPEAAESAAQHADDHDLGFPILVDGDQTIATRFGLAFELPAAAREVQTRLGAPLDRLNADGSWRLPVPATYIVDTTGTIRWAHVEDDYTIRAEPDEVIEALRTLA